MPVNEPFFDQDTMNKIVDYAMDVASLASPDEVLNRLHDIISGNNAIRVHGANRFSVKVGDWERLEPGKNLFIHRDVPRRWLEEWMAYVATGYAAGLMIARTCLAPFTWTELARKLDPIGSDRCPFDLALKHGMRDGYICPVGGRWSVVFWSPSVLGHSFTQQARGLLYMAAGAAAVRLESLVKADVKRVGSRADLSPRELSVLQQASNGLTLRETAKALGLGEETVLSHFKKAQAKLGTLNRTHSVAVAMRQLLIV
jgi:LuxR family quorum sensing-dependent transcriptional regulator